MNKEKTVKIVKTTANVAVGLSLHMITKNVLKTYVPTNSKADEVKLLVGTYVLSGMIADRGVDWIESRINGAVKTIESATSDNAEEPETE